jgi:hypothetical protein
MRWPACPPSPRHTPSGRRRRRVGGGAKVPAAATQPSPEPAVHGQHGCRLPQHLANRRHAAATIAAAASAANAAEVIPGLGVRAAPIAPALRGPGHIRLRILIVWYAVLGFFQKGILNPLKINGMAYPSESSQLQLVHFPTLVLKIQKIWHLRHRLLSEIMRNKRMDQIFFHSRHTEVKK